MAIGVGCDSGLSEAETSRKIQDLKDKYPEVLQYFWVSEPHCCHRLIREIAKINGLEAQCSFVVEWNNKDGPDLLKVIPKLLYEVFGTKVILAFDMDGEVIKPEDADLIAAKGFSPNRARYK